MSSSRGNFETRYPHIWLTLVHPSHNLNPKSLEIRIELHKKIGDVKRYTRIIKEADLNGRRVPEVIEYLSRQEIIEELKEPLLYLLKKVKDDAHSYVIPGGPRPDMTIW